MSKREVWENEMARRVVAGDLMECGIVVFVEGDFDAPKLQMAEQVEF